MTLLQPASACGPALLNTSASCARCSPVRASSTRRLPPDGLDPRIKSLNYLNPILARIEANHAGADEAVLLNAHGLVAEGTADNLFLVRAGILLTPPVTDGALPGITRELIMRLARASGIETRKRSLAPYDLHTADECFLSGTGAELVPVRVMSSPCRRGRRHPTRSSTTVMPI